MKIEKINSNGKQTLEKMMIPSDSVVFVLYDRDHKPVIQIFKDVNAPQTHRECVASLGAI